MVGIMVGNIRLDLHIGEKYEVINGEKTGSIKGNLRFKGEFIGETEYFYIFRCDKGFCETFLKVSMATKEYKVRSCLTKKYIPVYF